MSEFLTRLRFFFRRKPLANWMKNCSFIWSRRCRRNRGGDDAGRSPQAGTDRLRRSRKRARADLRAAARLVDGDGAAGYSLCAARISQKSNFHDHGDRDSGAGHRRDNCGIQRGRSDSLPSPAVCACGPSGFGRPGAIPGNAGVHAGRFLLRMARNQKPFEALTSEGAVSRQCDLTERNPEQLHCMPVLRNFLPTLGVTPFLGAIFQRMKATQRARRRDDFLCVVEESLQSQSKCSKSTDRYRRHQVRVIGVLPESFEMPDLQPADMLMPLALDEAQQHIVNGSIGSPMRTFARLKPGVSIAQARSEFAATVQRYSASSHHTFATFRNDFHLRIRSLRDRQMQDASLIAWVLLGSVLAVLLIACANVAGMLMARGALADANWRFVLRWEPVDFGWRVRH